MNEKTVLSVHDLSKRWDVSENTIRSMVSDHVLKPLPIFKTYKFSIHHILELEGINDIHPLSPLERRRLERENNELKEIVEKQDNVIREIVAPGISYISMREEKK